MKPRIKGLILFFIFLISVFSVCSYAKLRQVPETGDISKLPPWLESQLRQMRANERLMQKRIRQLETDLRGRSGQLPAPTVQGGATSVSTDSKYVNPVTGALQTQPEMNGALATEEQSVYLGESQGYFGVRRFTQGITVTTSPLLGVRSAFDASDLLYQYPSMNEDLILLRQRGFFEQHLAQIGDTLDNRAIVVLSGGLQAQIIYNRNFTGFSDGDINLTSAELDITPLVGSWANGFIALSFDSASASTGSRVENSRIYLSRGFITFGNIRKGIPVYVTVGQMYLPFGKYSSAMLTTPMTQSVARIQDRAALIGIFRDGFYGELYGYQGNRATGTQFTFKQGGVNAGYQMSNLDFGAGYVTNIADSQGMQSNGTSSLSAVLNSGDIVSVLSDQFAGFGETINGGNLVHNVGAADGHIEFFYGPFSVIAEYITTTQQFAPQDLTFNGSPANVKALHCETDFTMHAHNKPIVLGAIFEQSWDALTLNLPQNSYVLVINTSFFKNTSFGIEYRHDVNYAMTPLDATEGVGLPVPSANIGGTRNLVTIQFGAYF